MKKEHNHYFDSESKRDRYFGKSLCGCTLFRTPFALRFVDPGEKPSCVKCRAIASDIRNARPTYTCPCASCRRTDAPPQKLCAGAPSRCPNCMSSSYREFPSLQECLACGLRIDYHSREPMNQVYLRYLERVSKESSILEGTAPREE